MAVGGYSIARRLGQGGIGVVYLGRDENISPADLMSLKGFGDPVEIACFHGSPYQGWIVEHS